MFRQGCFPCRGMANKYEECIIAPSMDEGRKRVLLIAAAILVARHLRELNTRPTPALESLIHDTVNMAAKIMQRIDAMFPAGTQQPMRQ
jgi:hypothetical protein